MAKREVPEQALLLKLLRYDPSTGALLWRKRTAEHIGKSCVAHEVALKSWNERFAGKPAFTSDSGAGYRQGSIHSRNFYAHRVIWRMMTGEDPGFIDHISGDRGDNRFCNLRAVEKGENNRNVRLKDSNRSGCPGVRWVAKRRAWEARITKDGNILILGCFVDLAEAVRVRKAAERRLGFHPNHGRTGADSR